MTEKKERREIFLFLNRKKGFRLFLLEGGGERGKRHFTFFWKRPGLRWVGQGWCGGGGKKGKKKKRQTTTPLLIWDEKGRRRGESRLPNSLATLVLKKPWLKGPILCFQIEKKRKYTRGLIPHHPGGRGQKLNARPHHSPKDIFIRKGEGNTLLRGRRGGGAFNLWDGGEGGKGRGKSCLLTRKGKKKRFVRANKGGRPVFLAVKKGEKGGGELATFLA